MVEPGVFLLAAPRLTIGILCTEAAIFADIESIHPEPTLYGVTDGKAVGTYLEHKFRAYLEGKYTFAQGNSAAGIDFPALGVDIKVTAVTQPQSSCPFKSARQKIYGLGYGLLVFVYDKKDIPETRTATLNVLHTVYVEACRTGDFQITRLIRQALDNEGNEEDLIAIMVDKNLPLDEIEAKKIAKELLKSKPEQGYLTISNALQWRLQYSRIIEKAGQVKGISKLR